jgi:hypothetical protein
MASRTRSVSIGSIVLFLLAIFLPPFAPPAEALRVVDYNLLNYPGSSGTARAPYYRTILAPLNADVIVTEEISSSSGPTQFLNEVLNVIEPGQWATVPFIDGNDTDASLFYKPAKVQFLEQSAFYPNPSSLLRYVHVYRLMPVGYSSAGAELRLYAAHLKASTGYESQRLAECTGIRSHMNAMPAGIHALLCGDLNFYKQSTETGYGKLLESQTNNTGRVYDLLPGGEWHDSASLARNHTQSTCSSGTCASGAATGGMDDRFDFILPTVNLGTGQGMAIVPNSCIAVGNDGQHLNKSITDSPTIPEGGAYATALQLTSDHLPLRVDLRLPAEISTDPLLAFGTVIVGAPAQVRDLMVANPAWAPADSLNCSFAAPAGFGAPASLAVAAEESAPAPITMSATTSGLKSGNLVVSSDSPDDPTVSVGLSGTVLNHAVASLDSTSIVLTGSVDFGDHESGLFTPRAARVHNAGYNTLQALLSVGAATVTGGEGRFSLVDEFTGSLVGGTGFGLTLAFDDEAAVLDSTYTATLTLSCSDEPLPGAIPGPDLVVALRARVVRGQVGTSDPPSPTATRLFAPSPNPAVGTTALRLDVARAIDANVTIFDPSGRRVASLQEGLLLPGRYTLPWDGRTAGGSPASPGIYFVRLSAPGLGTQAVRLAVVR